MSKAILVMDMPSNCWDCPCSYFTEGAHWDNCQVLNNKELEENCMEEKPKWCPLREVPQKKDYDYCDHSTWTHERIGYNACINDILGGAE